MSRYDNFLDALAAGLVVAVFAAAVVVIVYLGEMLPLGILSPVLIFVAGVVIGTVVSLYSSKFFDKLEE